MPRKDGNAKSGRGCHQHWHPVLAEKARFGTNRRFLKVNGENRVGLRIERKEGVKQRRQITAGR